MITANTTRLEFSQDLYCPKRTHRARKHSSGTQKYHSPINPKHENTGSVYADFPHYCTPPKSIPRSYSENGSMYFKQNYSHLGSGDDVSTTPLSEKNISQSDLHGNVAGHIDTNFWNLTYWDGMIIPKGFSSSKKNSYHYTKQTEDASPISKRKLFVNEADVKMIKTLTKSTRAMAVTLKEASKLCEDVTNIDSDSIIQHCTPQLDNKSPLMYSGVCNTRMHQSRKKGKEKLDDLQNSMDMEDLMGVMDELGLEDKLCSHCLDFLSQCMCCKGEEKYTTWIKGKYIQDD